MSCADILTLINDLESENERLNECYKVKAYDKLRAENKKFKDRIAELEKENARLLDSVETVQNNRCVYKCELTKKQLKQFAERLKEKVIRPCDLYDCVTLADIDETLKEVIND